LTQNVLLAGLLSCCDKAAAQPIIVNTSFAVNIVTNPTLVNTKYNCQDHLGPHGVSKQALHAQLLPGLRLFSAGPNALLQNCKVKGAQ
jgi:hypothetical protein